MPTLDLVSRKKDATPADRSVPEGLKISVGNLNKLPTLPEAATKAMAIAKDPNCSLKQLAAVIERDPALAAGILKLANSPLYRIGRTIESLDQAVVRLGLRECQNLIIAVGMRALFRNVPINKKLHCEGLWRHSFVTACLSRHLNQALKLGYSGEEFACGLSHDIGRVLLCLGAPELFDAADPMDFVEGPESLPREREVLGTDHSYFGAWFASQNQLPASIVHVIQFHHDVEKAADHKLLVGLVATADHMANYIQREKRQAGYDALTNPGWSLLAREWTPDRNAGYLEALPRVMEAALREAQEVVNLQAG